MELRAEPLENVGAEVLGFNIDQALDADTSATLGEMWQEHAILLFRDQDITPERQIEFSRMFGPLVQHPLAVHNSVAHPELFVLENGGERDGYQTAIYRGEPIVGRLDWHMDLHYTGRPNRGALLRAVVVADEGGQTGFGDLAKAYDALDRDTKELLKKVEVAYRFNVQRLQMRFVDHEGYQPGPQSPKQPSDLGFPDFDDSIYPAVVEHPVTGHKVLEIVEQFLDRIVDPSRAGLDDNEADELLRRLVAHICKSEFHYFHTWQPGDMVLWDNWRAMHCTTGTKPGVHRLINRTTIAGDVAIGRQIKRAA